VTPSEAVLRPALAEDAAEVAEIHLRARGAAEKAGHMPAGIHTDDEVRAWLSGRLSADEVWVAEVDGAVAAYARFTKTWLDDLYVDPDRQGQGLGSALLALVTSLRPDGFGLWVFESNVPAQRFYARHGLVVTERTDGSGNEERAPDLRMEWSGTRLG
jgi:GNAT superfamily N-acetyltransferase